MCSSCGDTFWAAKALPAVFSRDGEGKLRICRPCNLSTKAFRSNLEKGNFRGALDVFRQGRIRTVAHAFGLSPVDGAFPIHCAAVGGSMDCIRWLVEAMGASVDVKDGQGNNPMKLAVKFGRGEAMRYFAQSCHLKVEVVSDTKQLQKVLQCILEYCPVPLPGTLGDPATEPPGIATAVQNATLPVGRPVSHPPQGPRGSHPPQQRTAGSQPPLPPGVYPHPPSLQPQAMSEPTVPTGRSLCVSCYTEPASCVVWPCGHTSMCGRCAGMQGVCATCHGRIEHSNPIFS